MAQITLTDPARLIIALKVAGYMRWFETRKGVSPTSQMMQLFIQGLLDEDGYCYDVDEPKRIDILALTLNVGMVEEFIKGSGIFDAFDRMAEQLRAAT